MKVIHPLEPFYNSDSKILILGTMPSIKSRELGFYYMHPQNRFWHILERIFNENIGSSITEKKEFLLKHNIALWDVLESCEITGSSDASIKNIKINNINKLIKDSKIERIYTTGKKAYLLYNKYVYPITKTEATLLYSPSSANCAISFEKIVENYQIINF